MQYKEFIAFIFVLRRNSRCPIVKSKQNKNELFEPTTKYNVYNAG